jgi:hypothetical protein
MIGTLCVYGNQQWRAEGLHAADAGELAFLYHCVAMVKNAEAEASEKARQKAREDADSGVTQG